MGLFSSKYVIRRFSPQTFQRGHASSGYQDFYALLNVQPFSPTSQGSNSEGERQERKVKTFGQLLFQVADQSSGTLGDWLYVQGVWYACVSSVLWNHTMLHHCRAEFVEVSETQASRMVAPSHLKTLKQLEESFDE